MSQFDGLDTALTPKMHDLLNTALASGAAKATGQGYDLHAPSKVIVPMATPLVNTLDRVPATQPGEEIAVSWLVPATALTSRDRDSIARGFSTLLYMLKMAEQAWLLIQITDWVHAQQGWSSPLATHLSDGVYSPETIQALRDLGLAVGVARGYHGVQTPEGDAVRLTVSIVLHLVTPDIKAVAA